MAVQSFSEVIDPALCVDPIVTRNQKNSFGGLHIKSTNINFSIKGRANGGNYVWWKVNAKIVIKIDSLTLDYKIQLKNDFKLKIYFELTFLPFATNIILQQICSLILFVLQICFHKSYFIFRLTFFIPFFNQDD